MVTYAHGEEIHVARSSRQLKWITKLVYYISDLVVANSESTRKLVISINHNTNVLTIHPGVNVDSFKRSGNELEWQKRRLGWPKDTILVSTVARMEPRKNHAIVIEAIYRLRSEGLSIAYICGGDGQEKDKLVRLAEKYKISKFVHFPGALSEEEKTLMFCASHIFAMPSIQVGEMIEGFGIVFLEAAAAGIPSVAGISGGQSEAVLNGKTGLVVDGRRVEEVAFAIRKLAKNPALRKRMGQNGIRWAEDNDWERVAGRIFSAVSENCFKRRRRWSPKFG
jgi:phosphatidylinositol alpha-1,6-mannosyltransferase